MRGCHPLPLVFKDHGADSVEAHGDHRNVTVAVCLDHEIAPAKVLENALALTATYVSAIKECREILYTPVGAGNFKTWFPRDLKRPAREKIFFIELKGRWINIGFTVENAAQVEGILREKALIRET